MTFIRRKLRDREYEESIRSVFSSLNDKIYRVLLLDILLSIYRAFYCLRFLAPTQLHPSRTGLRQFSLFFTPRTNLPRHVCPYIIRYIGDAAIRVRDEINELPR